MQTRISNMRTFIEIILIAMVGYALSMYFLIQLTNNL